MVLQSTLPYGWPSGMHNNASDGRQCHQTVQTINHGSHLAETQWCIS